jgi:hypothetical protein
MKSSKKNIELLESYIEEIEKILKEKKKKDDRCTRIAKRKYDVWPSAYASGAVVRCRRGEIWKGVSEGDCGTRDTYDDEVEVRSKKSRARGKRALLSLEELESLALNLETLLNEKKKKKSKTDYSKEKKSGLHGWFSRKGGGGSSGWVDCNTCRKDPKTGRKKCKACGRQKGEKRSKYPACRPTPSACGTAGKGKKWGKKSK